MNSFSSASELKQIYMILPLLNPSNNSPKNIYVYSIAHMCRLQHWKFGMLRETV